MMENLRFKFRVWDSLDRKYLDAHTVWLSSDGYAHEADCELSTIDYTIEQCTGLKDKNGKLIYEGDVVRVEDDYGVCNSDKHIDTGIGAVEWECEIWNIAGDVNNGLYEIDCTRYIEVIGNIHEDDMNIAYWLAQDIHALAELFVVRQFNSLHGVVKGVEPISWYSILIPNKTFKSRQEAVSESVNVLKREAYHRDFYKFMEEMRKYNAPAESEEGDDEP